MTITSFLEKLLKISKKLFEFIGKDILFPKDINKSASDNIKFVLPEKSGLMEKVKILFKEHYNKDVNFMFQEKVDEEVNVYVLRSDVSE